MAARFARAHQEDSARARRGPSEASVKFFDETFFQKSFDLALALTGRAAHKRKLGKQRSAFPERRRSEKAASRSPLRHAFGMTLSPAGSGDAAQWAASITDRRGSRDAGTAPAVTERAPHPKQKDTQQTLGVLLFFSVPCGCLTPLPRSSRRCPPPCRSGCR